MGRAIYLSQLVWIASAFFLDSLGIQSKLLGQWKPVLNFPLHIFYAHKYPIFTFHTDDCKIRVLHMISIMWMMKNEIKNHIRNSSEVSSSITHNFFHVFDCSINVPQQRRRKKSNVEFLVDALQMGYRVCKSCYRFYFLNQGDAPSATDQ